MHSDMKTRVFILLLLFLSLGTVYAQDTLVLSSFQKYVLLKNESAPKDELYEALYVSCIENIAVLGDESSDPQKIADAKAALINMWPDMSLAASYYDVRGREARRNGQDASGSFKRALQLAQSYIDIPLSPDFKNAGFHKDEYYPQMVYYAASLTYNSKDYERSINYFREYLALGIPQKRDYVTRFMADACIRCKEFEQAKLVLAQAVDEFPEDEDFLKLAINMCQETEDMKQMQKYVTKSLAKNPTDPSLLKLQGTIYESLGNYADALAIFTKLFELRPTSIEYARHVAMNNFNLGVMFSNKSAMEPDKKIASKYDAQAIMHFDNAIPMMKNVVASDPTSLLFHEAMAVAYKMTGNEYEFSQINKKIVDLGGREVTSGYIPSLMTVDKKYKDTASGSTYIRRDVPLFAEYAQQYMKENFEKWRVKDPYETEAEYKSRVTEKTSAAKIKTLQAEAESSYIKLYVREINISDFDLQIYDAENEVFLAKSVYGSVLIPVPRANGEARVFESTWKGTQCINPEYAIDNNNNIVLSAITFVTPMGQSYKYDDSKALRYTRTNVDVQFSEVDYAQYTSAVNSTVKGPVIEDKTISMDLSDVDGNIPKTRVANPKTFAVIIANEDYALVADVPMASNDGQIFSLYCERTLGLPKDNIRYYENASYGIMLRALEDIKEVAGAYNGDIDVIFYYAGHGVPNEASKDAFLLPVDADGTHTDSAYSLNRLYSELSGLQARSVLVFLDACFSGATREGAMLASARAVAVKPKPLIPQGNMVVFAAATGDQTAFPYEQKGHGMFTYFILKKLQETKGNVSLEEISEYVISNVRQQSVVVNKKSQTPVLTPSHSMAERWKKIKLRP